ncbi:hypothetical protein HY095_01130 [Candidatus Micrarchaeota archaeon]|nr:hypothetical protein [Candidatus Micrarchaeota archaeon]
MDFSKSLGKCGFCRKTFGKTEMPKHLAECEKGRAGGSKKRFFQLFVEGRRSPEYWMALAVPASCTLRDLDDYLRKAWLECCGHLSSFEINGKKFQSDDETAGEFGEKTIDVALSKVLSPGLTFFHEYDFGSTTELKLKVISDGAGIEGAAKPVLLARNLPPEISCESCGKKAASVCTACVYRGKGWCCKECAPKHKCGYEMALPVVNSPRAGICGYTGKPR